MTEHLDQEEFRRLAKRQKRERLELLFLEAWLDNFPKLPVPARQFMHNKKRKWRWDFAFPDQKLLVDIQGGTFTRGGHSRGLGHERDYEKHNDAVRLGYRTLLFGTEAMKDPDAVVTFVAEILCNAQEIGTTRES